MSRNLFAVVGALAALAILFTASFAGLASAEDPTVVGGAMDAVVGQEYTLSFQYSLTLAFSPSFGGPGYDNAVVEIRSTPTWLTEISGYTEALGNNRYKVLVDKFSISGTPTTAGEYKLLTSYYTQETDGTFKKLSDSSGGDGTWTINVAAQPPHTVTFVSDPLPTSISTSAGIVALSEGKAIVSDGTIMHEPNLQRERQILHRWTDAAGNTYDWSKPVSSGLTLTADWREHYSVAIDGNKATVTLSSSLPTEYPTHKVNWGDNTENRELTHLYALPGEYTITVTSGDWYTWASSSTTVKVEQVTVVTYTVTFNPAGGSVVPGQTVESGHLATEPAAPTRQGYNFTGWLKDGQRYDFSTPVTGNLYLSAGWEAVPPGDDKDEEQGHDLLLIALAVLSLVSLAITLLTRSPYAIALTIILALVELALLALGISGVIA